MSIKFVLDLLINDSALRVAGDALDSMSLEDPDRVRAEREQREDAAQRKRRLEKRFPNVNPFDRSPIHLTRGAIEGDAFEVEKDGDWQFVVTVPEPRPAFVIMPRHGQPDAPRDVTGEIVFDRRFTVFGQTREIAKVGHRLRKLFNKTACDWIYGRGTMTATTKQFRSRHHILGLLDEGLDIAEALMAAAREGPEVLLAAISDPAWKVGAAALDTLLEEHPTSRELGHAYDFVHTNRGPQYERLRVHAFRRAQDWRAVQGVALGAHREARSDAFEVLLAHAPDELAAQAASTLMLTRDGLDDERVAKVMRALAEGDPRLYAVTTPEVRELFLVAVFEPERDGRELDDLPLARAAAELLATTGSGLAYAQLSAHASRSRRAAALAARVKARLGGGGLALAEGEHGGLAMVDPE